MAERKKSFVLYSDLLHTVAKMPKDKAGELFLIILQYVNDLNPVVNDLLVDIVFEPIKQQMNRDSVKWDATREKRSEAGKASAAAKKKSSKTDQKSTKPTSVNTPKQTSTHVDSVEKKPTKSTVNVNGNVNVNVINIEVEEEEILQNENFEETEEIIIPPLVEGAVNEEEKIASINFLKGHSMFTLIQKQQSLKPPEVIKLFETFYETKSVLREISGKSKDEVLRHFLYWVPKYQTTKSQPRPVKNIPNGTPNHFTPRNRTTAARADELRDDRNLLVDSLRGLLRGTAPKE
ncbi:DUF6291 domain-containing protein [Pedobacter sp.]|uniref:DUF6291 domain-containing protein n=1 Tax=Pedobacter sp. TaxID=1411316 RepID=UPI003D7F3FAF